jgi:hypothetical protein
LKTHARTQLSMQQNVQRNATRAARLAAKFGAFSVIGPRFYCTLNLHLCAADDLLHIQTVLQV